MLSIDRSLTPHARTVPHGGYLTTVLINASTHYFTHSPAARALAQPHAIHSALTFVTRCAVGAATVQVTPLKLGRQYSFVRVVLRQSGHVRIDATITHACIERESGATLHTLGMAAYAAVPDRVGDCSEMPPATGAVAVFRVATGKLKYRFPNEGRLGVGRAGPSVREQWVKLDDGSNAGFGVADLGFLCDTVSPPPAPSPRERLMHGQFIPIPENYAELAKRVYWYPTLSLSLDVKALPPKGGWEWLYCRIECAVIRGGRMDIGVVICDEDSNIVAISRHVAVVVDSARNTVKQALEAKL